ncbi:MAG: site-specific integrase, partial [Coriobacteriia bacterium]|nr:site-specific integrase [Coriobacteriia bacterium]
FYILLNTGLRISEFCGLTVGDIDFERGSVCVSKQLQRSSDMRYYIERPKTSSGVRYVPMSEGVAECFRRVVANRPKPPMEPVVDGVSGFLFLDKNQKPRVALHWEKYFQYAVAKHNRIYKDELPKITPHVCRHTFCSKMARKGMDPVKLKYVMGHSDIDVTYNTYTHLGFDDVKADVLRFEEEAA